jgi:hypothetical protein
MQHAGGIAVFCCANSLRSVYRNFALNNNRPGPGFTTPGFISRGHFNGKMNLFLLLRGAILIITKSLQRIENNEHGLYSRCQKNIAIAGRFFATTLMPPSFFGTL